MSGGEFEVQKQEQNNSNKQESSAGPYLSGELIKIYHSFSRISSIFTDTSMYMLANTTFSVNTAGSRAVNTSMINPALIFDEIDESTRRWDDLISNIDLSIDELEKLVNLV